MDKFVCTNRDTQISNAEKLLRQFYSLSGTRQYNGKWCTHIFLLLDFVGLHSC